MEIMDYSTIYAENNYWGTSSPTSSLFLVSSSSSFDYHPYLTSVPTGALAINPEEEVFDKKFATQLSSLDNSTASLLTLESPTLNSENGFDENWQIEWKLLYARNLIRVKKYNSASDICESVITQYPDSSLSHFALHLLHQARLQNKKKIEFKDYINNKLNLKSKKRLYGNAELLILLDKNESRIKELDDLREKYNNTEIVESILYDKFLFYLNEKSDMNNAELVSEELGKLFPNSKSYLSSQIQLGGFVDENLGQLKKQDDGNSTLDNEIPKTYKLLGNYPNPFNPSTTISYAIPFVSKVNMDIYDISGSLVKSFEIGSLSARRHQIIWDGTNELGAKAASGIYLYQFRAVSYEGNGEVFEKTAKLLL